MDVRATDRTLSGLAGTSSAFCTISNGGEGRNNEEGDAGQTVTTMTREETAGKTRLVVHDLYFSKEAVDTGSTGAMPEVLDQLEELLASLGSSTESK